MSRSTNSSPTNESDDDVVKGLELLIEAANYVENCESKRQRESDHGYASTFKCDDDDEPMKKRLKTAKKSQSRTSHNELEKNRRAHLRNCLDNLKSIVPLGSGSTRHTTLGLLKKATLLIKDLEVKKVSFEQEKDKLGKYNEHLKEMLFRLEIKYERFRRNSTGSSTSLSECSNDSDKDEIIDVLDTSCSSGDELIQVMTASNDANSMLMSMPEILIAST